VFDGQPNVRFIEPRPVKKCKYSVKTEQVKVNKMPFLTNNSLGLCASIVDRYTANEQLVSGVLSN